MILKLSWRNIWKNKKRSVITITAIGFAVFLALAMRSLQLGTYDHMINNMVKSTSGPLRINYTPYIDESNLDNALFNDSIDVHRIWNIEGVEDVLFRIESYGLVAMENNTKPLSILSTDLDLEEPYLQLESHLIKGELPSAENKGVVIGKGVSERLKCAVGDTLAIISQGFQGISAAQKFKVTGVVELFSALYNDQTVFMTREDGEYFFSMPGMSTTVVIQTESMNGLQRIERKIKPLLTSDLTIRDWTIYMREIKQAIQTDDAGGKIMIFILYMVITFGIFGTILMMTSERIYEFGVLISIGFSRLKLISQILLEVVILSMIGVIVGAVLSYPIILYFNIHPIHLGGEMAEGMKNMGWDPIMLSSTDPTIVLTHALIILFVSLLMTLYPIITIARLKPVEAMRTI